MKTDFLSHTGDDLPSFEKPAGPYPTYVTQTATGKVVPVVQAYCYSKYVGLFDLYFDSNGDLKVPVNGAGVKNAKPHLLVNSIAQDEDVLEVISVYRPNMTEYTKVVGETLNKLTTNGLWESNLGNAITDAYVTASEWNDTTIGFMNNGGIRYNLHTEGGGGGGKGVCY
jgi:2',3'-cyclic-nucleotide 2'-phosphodiesterase (5'-nucleotidase family)